jgi:cellulose synthase/poly-beta-1,6-N-acetylglucosamine synthase-like glycosyltransferase
MELLARAIEMGLWTCLLAIAYVYLGYPLTLLVLPRKRRAARPLSALPTVTVVIAAFNEVADIGATVRDKLSQDYPPDLLDVVVVSDGSTDGTDEAVAALREPRVTLVRQEPRQGKTLALNRGVSISRGEVIVFSDANSHYEPTAIAHLVSCFADPEVGYVTGRLVYEDPRDTAVGGGSGLYMRYESWLRELESRVGSIVGVNGGVDAVRRRLYQPMAVDHLPDFILPLRVVQQGFRVVACDDAVAHEQALGQQADEFRMRVRVSLRALHALTEMRALFHPRYGLFAFQLLVHKLMRYLMIVPIAGVALFSALLVGQPLYRVLFEAQIVVYALALAGWLSGGRIRFRPVFVPFYFCLVNIAATVALVGFLRGERQVLWTPRKGA